jgi:hypothetical protein
MSNGLPREVGLVPTYMSDWTAAILRVLAFVYYIT